MGCNPVNSVGEHHAGDPGTATVGDVIATGILGGAIVVGTMILALWALRRHRRLYPPRTRLGTDEESRTGEMKWYGFIYGGGRG